MNKLIDTLLYGAGGAFSWSENSLKIIVTALLSMVPAFEGRYALGVAQAMGMPALPAFFIALICSTLPMPVVFLLMRPILDIMYKLPIGFIKKFAAWVDDHAARRAATVDKKGLLGLFLFVALPLPGTGVWTGSAIATLLKMNKKQAATVIIVGNIVACTITTVLTYMGVKLFS